MSEEGASSTYVRYLQKIDLVIVMILISCSYFWRAPKVVVEILIVCHHGQLGISLTFPPFMHGVKT